MLRDATILLCDDEYPILRAAEFKLKRAGYQVICGSDGQEAWEIIQQLRPDLLVTDLQMPRLNGLELCKQVRSMPETREMPIIMLTAKGFELSVDDIREEYGVIELLSKPFSPRGLLQLVDDTLEQNPDSCGEPAAEAIPFDVQEPREILP